MVVSSEEARNARLPEELWQSIFQDLGGEGYPIALDTELDSLDRSLPSLRATCRALRQWCRSWIWATARISDVGELKYFMRRVEDFPGALNLIKNFSVTLRWDWDSEYSYDWQICGPPETWYFADRAPKKKEFLLKNVIPKEEQNDMDSWTEDDWDEDYDIKHLSGWSHGYDGEGEDSLVKSAQDFRKLLTPLVERMNNLRRFHWGTNIIPLNAQICRALANAEHLQEVSFGPSGQFYTNSFSQSPLWLIFEDRKNRPLPCLYLNIEILPSSRQFRDAEDALGQPPDESLAALADCYKDGKGLIKIPDPDRYLRYTYQDEAVEPELNFVERPLAMFYRTMMASRGCLCHVQTTELAVARIQDLLPIWAQTALTGFDYNQKRQNFREDSFLQAAADLQPALASLMTSSRTLPAEDSLDRFFQSRKALEPLLPCIQNNGKLQTDLWEAFLEGKRASLPDWTRPPLPDNPELLRHFSMRWEHYIRDLP